MAGTKAQTGVQEQVLSAMTDEVFHFKTLTLPTKPTQLSNWQRVLLALRLAQPTVNEPQTVRLELRGTTLRTVQKISLHILRMRTESKLTGDDWIHDIMAAGIDDLAYIIALAVHNQNSPVPPMLVEAILDGLTNAETAAIAAEVYRRLDIESFFGIMASLKNLTIVTGTQETTANPPLSETSSSPTS